MRRPTATLETLSRPLIETRRADASGIERVPQVAAGARPAVVLAGRPAAEWAPDSRRFRRARLRIVQKLPVWNDDRIVSDRAHARYYHLRPDHLGSVRLGSARLGSARLGSARLGSARLGSARLGSARLGSARLGSARLGSARLGSVRRFTEASAQHQPYSAATAYSALQRRNTILVR
jgi:hypothetical protein